MTEFMRAVCVSCGRSHNVPAPRTVWHGQLIKAESLPNGDVRYIARTEGGYLFSFTGNAEVQEKVSRHPGEWFTLDLRK